MSIDLGVEGLTYLREFIPAELAPVLLADIDSRPWSDKLARRTQHYGYEYDYRARNSPPRTTTAIPDLLVQLGAILPGFARPPDQVIVNEYNPGQGISAHTDSNVFGPTVASLSLGSPCVMEFTRAADPGSQNPPKYIELDLEPSSLVVLTGPARYQWRHAIPARKTDHGRRRTRRVSVTFRTLASRK
jgi:alkylated DNA repair dioxygenase AlkB